MYIIVAGAGIVGGELARRLLENKHDVVVVDKDREACDKLYAETGAVVVCGKVSRIEVLREAGIGKADVLVAATADDAENLICTILARSNGVPRVVARMRDPAYESALKQAGAESLVRVTDMMVSQMVTEVEQPDVRNITAIGGGKANIFMVTVPREGSVVGRSVAEVATSSSFPGECVFVAVYNPENNEFAIPRGNRVIGGGDQLFLIANAEDIKKASDFLRRQKQ